MPATADERSTTAACIAYLTEAPLAEVPAGDGERAAWLAGRGLGLVPVDRPGAFSWPGPWIALRGPERHAVVMFGVPSGVVFDPAGAAEAPIVAGFLLAPHDVSLWGAPDSPPAGQGIVEAIVLAPEREGPTRAVDAVEAIPGRGLAGDRYAAGSGTFGSGRPGSALTLIDAEVLDELGPIDHRRNVVVRGLEVRALIGHEFTIGAVRCRGQRPAEPCAHLDRLNGGGVLRPLVHRAGLRADILGPGTIAIGDEVAAI